jgi:site-specific DNA recombinase
MRVVLYARYSTEKQDALTIDVQLAKCRRQLELRGWTEVDCFTDGAQSGATLHRPGMQALLARVDRGSVAWYLRTQWTVSLAVRLTSPGSTNS